MLLSFLGAMFVVLHHGAPIPYRGTGGLIGDAITVIMVMTVVMSKRCLWRRVEVKRYLGILDNFIPQGLELVYPLLGRSVGAFSVHFFFLCLTYFVIF